MYLHIKMGAISQSDGNPQSGLQDLPLEVLQLITGYIVLSCGLYKSPRLRLINSAYTMPQEENVTHEYRIL